MAARFDVIRSDPSELKPESHTMVARNKSGNVEPLARVETKRLTPNEAAIESARHSLDRGAVCGCAS
ncbi:MAG TPA: hypothetical protein VFK10_06070 [Burkholderiaceae bacterium]|nr:hypothetical protein [Burkholderiaceae bacterium]